MQTRTEELYAKGGLYEASAEVVQASSNAHVLEAFAKARERGLQLTLVGSRRSIGEQFLPPAGVLALDVGALGRGARVLAVDQDGAVWVEAGGGTRFVDLKQMFPGHRTGCPPTTDNVSVAGALAACTHNSFGYFADSVRAFTLITPEGESIRCRRDASGAEGELFWGAIGAFGALGVVTDVELRLQKIEPERQVVIHALYAGPAKDGRYLDELERAVDSGRYGEGAGAVVYGQRGHAIVLADELLPPGEKHLGGQALLTDDDFESQALTQGFANRFPRVAEWAVRRSYPQGTALWAPWYGFQFYQRGYDRAPTILSGASWKAVMMRAMGVQPRLPVCHQAWFYPRRELRAFMELYWQTLARYPGIEQQAEQQDIVLLGPCRYPSHSIGETREPVGVLTASFAVQRGESSELLAAQFLREFSSACFAELPSVRVSLCKQVHCESSVLRGMHAEWVSRVRSLRRLTDPRGLLTSRFLAQMGASSSAD